MSKNDWTSKSFVEKMKDYTSWDSSQDSLGDCGPMPLEAPRGRILSGLSEEGDLFFDGWNSFLRLWDHRGMRALIARRIPELVVIIWQPEYIELGDFVSAIDKRAGGTKELLQRAARKTQSDADMDSMMACQRLIDSLLQRTNITTAAFFLALFFIYRYRTIPDSEFGDPGSQYRMFLITLIVAHKYTEDYPFCNKVWAKLTGFPTGHINEMERDFLHRIDHRIKVEVADFQHWVVCLDTRFSWTSGWSEEASGETYKKRLLPPTPTSLASTSLTEKESRFDQ